MLDVGRVEVGEAVRGVVGVRREGALAERASGDGVDAGLDHVVGDDDAVHHVERRRGAVDRADAADLDLEAAARGAGVLLDEDAGDLAGEGVLDGGGGSAIELFARDDGDVHRGVPAGDGGRRAGDHLGLEQEDVALEGHGDLAVRRRCRDDARLVADAADAERHVAGRHREGEAAVLAGRGAEGGADDGHGRRAERLVRVLRGHAADDPAPLGLRLPALPGQRAGAGGDAERGQEGEDGHEPSVSAHGGSPGPVGEPRVQYHAILHAIFHARI